jgi:ribosomal protein L44E
MSKRTPKYAPLGEFLAELPTSKSAITLGFTDIEEIIAQTLPSSASQYREWWANQKGGSRAPHWQRAGFVVAAVDLSRKFVCFERGESAMRHKKIGIHVCRRLARFLKGYVLYDTIRPTRSAKTHRRIHNLRLKCVDSRNQHRSVEHAVNDPPISSSDVAVIVMYNRRFPVLSGPRTSY